MADNVDITPGTGATIAADEVSIDGTTAKVQRVKPVHGVAGAAVDASAANPFPTTEGGTYGYAAGTAAGTVDVPSGARVKRVSVLPGAGTATVTIAGGPTITIPQGGGFDEQIPGQAAAGGDVVIGGTVSSYYVSWVS